MSSGVMAYMARRILMLIPLLLGLSLIMFTLIQAAPGDPVLAMMGEQAASNPEYVEQTRKNLGLDRLGGAVVDRHPGTRHVEDQTTKSGMLCHHGLATRAQTQLLHAEHVLRRQIDGRQAKPCSHRAFRELHGVLFSDHENSSGAGVTMNDGSLHEVLRWLELA